MPERFPAADLKELLPAELARLRAIGSELGAARWNSWDRNVKAIPLLLKGTPEKFLDKLNTREYGVRWTLGAQSQSFDFWLIDTYQGPYVSETRFVFFQFYRSVWVILAADPRYVYKYLVKRVSRLSQLVSPVFLSTRDFRNIFQDLSLEDHRLRIFQHSAYNARESSIRFLKEERRPEPVFQELVDSSLVVRNISGGIRSPGNEDEKIVQFRIANNSSVSLTTGTVGFLLESIMLSIARIALRKNALLSDRERSDQSFSPLDISFDRDVFEEKIANRKFIQVLSNTEKLGVGVFHANPYIHLILTDFRDGSRFTLYTQSERQLKLVPSFAASVSSITRIHRAISEGFAACELSEPTTMTFTIEDLFPEA